MAYYGNRVRLYKIRTYNLRIHDDKGYLGFATFSTISDALECADKWLKEGYKLTLVSRGSNR